MIKLVIPGIPPSVNKWRNMHHYQEANEKKYWEQVVWAEVHRQKIKPSQPLSKATVRYRYYFSSKRRHDPDNYAGKWIMDGLVKAGVLEDDSFDHVKLEIEQGGVDRKNPRVEITIKDMGGKLMDVRDRPDGTLYCAECGQEVSNTANHEMRKEGVFSHDHWCPVDVERARERRERREQLPKTQEAPKEKEADGLAKDS